MYLEPVQGLACSARGRVHLLPAQSLAQPLDLALHCIKTTTHLGRGLIRTARRSGVTRHIIRPRAVRNAVAPVSGRYAALGVSQYAQEVSGSRQMMGSFSAKAGVVRSRMAMMERIVPQRLPRQAVARNCRVYPGATPRCYAFSRRNRIGFGFL